MNAVDFLRKTKINAVKIADAGPSRRLIGLKLEGRRSPRQGMSVMQGSEKLGEVTSGCLSPTLGYPIAMAYVPADAASEGSTLTVDVGGGTNAEIVPMPFYKR